MCASWRLVPSCDRRTDSRFRHMGLSLRPIAPMPCCLPAESRAYLPRLLIRISYPPSNSIPHDSSLAPSVQVPSSLNDLDCFLVVVRQLIRMHAETFKLLVWNLWTSLWYAKEASRRLEAALLRSIWWGGWWNPCSISRNDAPPCYRSCRLDSRNFMAH